MELRGITDGRSWDTRERQVLEHLRDYPKQTQSQIAEALGITRQAVNKILARRPGGDGAVAPTTSPQNRWPKGSLGALLDAKGHRSTHYALPAKRAWLLSVDFGAKHVRVMSSNFQRTSESPSAPEPCDVLFDPSAALTAAAELIEAERKRRKFRKQDVAGIVVGLPFAVHEGRARDPGPWRYVQVGAQLREILGWKVRPPVRVRSDAQLGALAEWDALRRRRYGRKDGALPLPRGLLYVKFSTKLSGAAVVWGQVLDGFSGHAGSFLHTPAKPYLEDAPTCEECARHCTSSVAALQRVFDDVERLGHPIAGADTEKRAAALIAIRDGTPRKRLAHAAETLGRSLGSAANTLDPERVVIGGAFTSQLASSEILALVDLGFQETAHPSIARANPLRGGTETGKAAAAGGIALGLHEFAVDFLLRRLEAEREELLPRPDEVAAEDDESEDDALRETPAV
jgi:predicted NBD/HSP70 family sugar kinase